VTVLLAVLKDSMGLMVDRNPEETRYLLDSVVDRMLIFNYYEGTVELTA
jgi:hypothetical protein